MGWFSGENGGRVVAKKKKTKSGGPSPKGSVGTSKKFGYSGYLMSVIHAEVYGKPLPLPSNALARSEIVAAGGPSQWATKREGYAELKKKLERKRSQAIQPKLVPALGERAAQRAAPQLQTAIKPGAKRSREWAQLKATAISKMSSLSIPQLQSLIATLDEMLPANLRGRVS